jgi:hypothetical protein
VKLPRPARACCHGRQRTRHGHCDHGQRGGEGGSTLAAPRGGEGWGLGAGTTWAQRRREVVDMALLLDPETGEGVDTDDWEPGTVTSGGGLF